MISTVGPNQLVKSWTAAPIKSTVHSYRVIKNRKAIDLVLRDKDQYGLQTHYRFTFELLADLNRAHGQLLRAFRSNSEIEDPAKHVAFSWTRDYSCLHTVLPRANLA